MKINLGYLAKILALSLCLVLPADASLIKWSLPMDGPLPIRVPTNLTGGVSSTGDNDFSQRLEVLLDTALERDPKMKELDNLVKHYSTPSQKVIAETKDGFDYLIPYRGFGPSKEAGNAILGENMKIKSIAAARYARQKKIDETHLAIVINVMQLAMGMGLADHNKGNKIMIEAVKNLKDLVGEEEARKTFQLLSSWNENLKISEEIYEQPVWDIHEKNNKYKGVLSKALDDDPVIRAIIKAIHGYNQKGKFTMASASVIQTVLATGALTPTFIGPACKLALLTYIMSTGGPEQRKILKELYLDKRFESRFNVFSEETHLAIESYQLGLLTRNPLLLGLSESLIEEMAGSETTREVLGASLFK